MVLKTKVIIICLINLISFNFVYTNTIQRIYSYKDPTISIEKRVEDLIARMTLEEKIGQMLQFSAAQKDIEALIETKLIGSVLHARKPETVRALQKIAIEKTRLGIPLLMADDAVRGHGFCKGATIFPTQLATSCSWNADLAAEIGRVTAREMSSVGMHWNFGPILCMARDLRWGRIDETFGEDGLIISDMASAMIRGLQGNKLSDDGSVLACAKHFAGYSETHGGRDGTEADHTKRKMLSLFLPPFYQAVQANCATMMIAYNAIDGVPCSINQWLLTNILKKEWEFKGFTVTDWDNVGKLHTSKMVSADMNDAVKRALLAGNDMIMSTPSFYQHALDLVRSGNVDESIITESCRKILFMKFELGLFDSFEKIYPEDLQTNVLLSSEEHRKVALQVARESVVLLANDNHILPLNKKKICKVAVIGPCADVLLSHHGDWVSWAKEGTDFEKDMRQQTITVRRGITELLDKMADVMYCRGCPVYNEAELYKKDGLEGFKPASDKEMDEAIKLAGQSEVSVVCIGDSPSIIGECRDRADLQILGRQLELVERSIETGTPTIVVLICSKPHILPEWLREKASAILCGFNPGDLGGQAIAEILFGEVNPSGKLTISWPAHIGQTPVFYNQLPGWHGNPPRYVDLDWRPMFTFGHGLSYTQFEYSDLIVQNKELQAGQSIKVMIKLKNIGSLQGDEIVQCYINDVYSSVTTPVKQLAAYKRVSLKQNETKTVTLEIPFDRLSLINQNLDKVVESGVFEIMVGGSSMDENLIKTNVTYKK